MREETKKRGESEKVFFGENPDISKGQELLRKTDVDYLQQLLEEENFNNILIAFKDKGERKHALRRSCTYGNCHTFKTCDCKEKQSAIREYGKLVNMDVPGSKISPQDYVILYKNLPACSSIRHRLILRCAARYAQK